ncbi:hypothetical protein [Desulfosediminicola sp.]|uniref:hypothetical protein n=1 Tax=Desulfosediminicola sp. TaxID=2886825 RepID=UPI003AF1EB15
MTVLEIQKNILQVLADNIHNNLSPDVMDSDTIARCLSVRQETVAEALKVMNDTGVVVTNIENRYSIITGEGLKCLQRSSDAQESV